MFYEEGRSRFYSFDVNDRVTTPRGGGCRGGNCFVDAMLVVKVIVFPQVCTMSILLLWVK